ncbi:hypothetical protein BSIG_5962 [Bacteroides thetaiotaomicron]|nr:hypothetical protein BSIG_5962 [Bacteroides thetaiotaomicron]
MWKKLMKRKIQRLLKGSFPPHWGEFFFQTPKKNQKGLIASLCYAPIVLLSVNPPTLLRYVSLSNNPIRTIGKEIDTVLFRVPALMGKRSMMK